MSWKGGKIQRGLTWLAEESNKPGDHSPGQLEGCLLLHPEFLGADSFNICSFQIAKAAINPNPQILLPACESFITRYLLRVACVDILLTAEHFIPCYYLKPPGKITHPESCHEDILKMEAAINDADTSGCHLGHYSWLDHLC